MENSEIDDFINYVQRINASFDEWQMLISIMIREAAEEHTHRQMLEEIEENDLQTIDNEIRDRNLDPA